MIEESKQSSDPQAPRFAPHLPCEPGEFGFTLNGFTVKGETHNTLACELVDEVVRAFGEVRLRVFGTSMVPSILPGDLISVERAALSEISAGEIVLFSRQGRLFAHRVVAGADDSSHTSSLVTRGDRLGYNDPPVSSSELLGRVVSVQRDGRQIQPAATLRGYERMIVRLLRHSDHATYLYVKLAKIGLMGRQHDAPLRHGETHDSQRSNRRDECRV